MPYAPICCSCRASRSSYLYCPVREAVVRTIISVTIRRTLRLSPGHRFAVLALGALRDSGYAVLIFTEGEGQHKELFSPPVALRRRVRAQSPLCSGLPRESSTTGGPNIRRAAEWCSIA